jgi:hypothetical protein
MRGRQIASPMARFRYDCSSASMVTSIVSNLATSALLMMSVIAALASNFRRKFFTASRAQPITYEATPPRKGHAASPAQRHARRPKSSQYDPPSVMTVWGQNEPCHSLRRHDRSTSVSGPAGSAVGASGSGQKRPFPVFVARMTLACTRDSFRQKNSGAERGFL